MEKEQFIENVLNSTNGMQPMQPSDDLLDRINARINEEKPIQKSYQWLVAASIVLLIGLNAGILSQNKAEKEYTNDISSLVVPTNNNLY